MSAGVMRLEWYGEQILGQIRSRVEAGMNGVLADAAALAQVHAPVDTGALRNDITFKPAVIVGGGLVGSFGAYSIHYAIYQELGTWKMAARPFLRPAADAVFPSLLSRIGRLG